MTNLFEQKREKFNAEIDAKTKLYQKKYGFEISDDPKHPTWNNESDAFKHAFMQAIIQFNDGSIGSNGIGYYHEIENIFNKDPLVETNMDLWNNEIGRKIGNKIKQYVMGKRKSDFSQKKNRGYDS